MSLSKLQSQLVALNNNSNNSNNTGLIVSSNKQHNNAIGHGIQYSVQHGTSSTTKSNIQYQPTLLYNSTRIAATISLSTIQEQCTIAIQTINDLLLSSSINSNNNNNTNQMYYHWFQYLSNHLFVVASSSDTMMMATTTTTTTDSSNSSHIIRQMLLLLSCLFVEGSTSTSTTTNSNNYDNDNNNTSDDDNTTSNHNPFYIPCMYILEYMIRQYHIHIDYSIDLLWCLLPLIVVGVGGGGGGGTTTNTIIPKYILHRCLLLCDWTGSSSSNTNQSYLWLRPYCIEIVGNDPNHNNNNNISLPSISIIAKEVYIHIDILRYICTNIIQMIHSIYYQYSTTTTTIKNDSDNNNDIVDVTPIAVLPNGMSHILSYMTSILIQGLHQHQQQQVDDHHDHHTESIIRTLLPTISYMMMKQQQQQQQMNYNNNTIIMIEEFYNCGYIVSYTMIETMIHILSSRIIIHLCQTIIHSMIPIVSSSSVVSVSLSNNNNNNNNNNIQTNAMSCLISILYIVQKQYNESTMMIDSIDEDMNDDSNENDNEATTTKFYQTNTNYIPLIEVVGLLDNNNSSNTTMKMIGCTKHIFTLTLYDTIIQTFHNLSQQQQEHKSVQLPNIFCDLLQEVVYYDSINDNNNNNTTTTETKKNTKMIYMISCMIGTLVAQFIHQLYHTNKDDDDGDDDKNDKDDDNVEDEDDALHNKKDKNNNNNESSPENEHQYDNTLQIILSLFYHETFQQIYWNNNNNDSNNDDIRTTTTTTTTPNSNNTTTVSVQQQQLLLPQQLITSITVYIIEHYCYFYYNNCNTTTTTTSRIGNTTSDGNDEDDDDDSDHHHKYSYYHHEILLALYHCDPINTERGIAYIVMKHENNKVQNDDNTYRIMKQLLHGIIDTTLTTGITATSNDNSHSTTVHSLLPTRMALDHIDPTIRLQAVETIHQQIISSSSSSTTKMNNLDQSVLLERLLYKMMYDKNVQVRMAIGKMISSWFQYQNENLGDILLITETNALHMIELALLTFFQVCIDVGTDSDIGNNESMKLLLQYAVTILCRIVRIVGRMGSADLLPLWQISVEVLVGHIYNTERDTTAPSIDENEKSLLSVLMDSDDVLADTDATETRTTNDVQAVILDCDPFIERLLLHDVEKVKFATIEMSDSMRTMECMLQRKCEWVIMKILLDSITTTDDSCDMASPDMIEQQRSHATTLLSLCLKHIQKATNTDLFTELECEILKGSVIKSWKILLTELHEHIPVYLIQLASTESKILWGTFSGMDFQSLITNVTNSYGQLISKYVILFECVMRLYHVGTKSSVLAIKRFLSVAKTIITEKIHTEIDDPWLCIVPALSLLQNNDRGVRIAAANFLREAEQCTVTTTKTTKGKRNDSSISDDMTILLKEICQKIPLAKSQGKLDESNFLSSFMASCIQESSKASVLREKMLALCFCTSISSNTISNERKKSLSEVVKHCWLPLRYAIGGCTAATILLEATELAGEDAYPLLSRWKSTGSKLIETFVHPDSQILDDQGSYPPHLIKLANCVATMLKGVTVTDPVIMLSTGPVSSRPGIGGRARSYSLGKMDGITILTPYPEDMIASLIRVMSHPTEVAGAMIMAKAIHKVVLVSATWGECVFKCLPAQARRALAASVIEYVGIDGGHELPVGVPLNASDICELLTMDNETNFIRTSVLVDFVRNNVARIRNDKAIVRLIETLFDRLQKVNSIQSEDFMGSDEQLIQDIMITVGCLMSDSTTSKKFKAINNEIVQGWATLLLCLLGQTLSFRSKSLILSILPTLCSLFPKTIISSMIEAPIKMITNCPSNYPVDQMAALAFSKTVPSYIVHAVDADLSLTDFLHDLVTSTNALKLVDKGKMYGELIKTFSRCSQDTNVGIDNSYEGLGALQAFYLSYYANGELIESDESLHINFAVNLLQYGSESEQMSSLLLLLNYSIGLIHLFQDDEGQLYEIRTTNKMIPSLHDVAILASTGDLSNNQKRDTQKLFFLETSSKKSIHTAILLMLRTFRDGLMLDSTCDCIKSGVGDASKFSLLLWQDLLLLQSLSPFNTSTDNHDCDKTFQDSVSGLVNECREYLQRTLPSHVFLASVTALIKEGGTSEIRSHALRLLADRVLHVDPDSPEVLLFLDVVPNINEVIMSTSFGNDSRGDVILIQSALFAMDHVTRHLSQQSMSSRLSYFVDTLRLCTKIIVNCSTNLTELHQNSSITNDLISTVALCCASLVQVVGVSCLAILPDLMKAFTNILKVISKGMVSDESIVIEKRYKQARVAQLSILQCMVVIAETTPQFLPPYLSELLTRSVILSKSLRIKSENREISAASMPVAETVDKLCVAISTRVAARIVIPAASRALQQQVLRSNEIIVLMDILESSISNASTTTVVAQKEYILSALTKSLEYHGEWEEQYTLTVKVCQLVHTLVMKISENELRRFYKSLLSWRNDIVLDDPKRNGRKRYAFWMISAQLSKHLRTIFLPCFDSVFDDVVNELNIAVKTLCPSTHRTGKSNKRQKIDHIVHQPSSTDETEITMRIIQPLLFTIEQCLRADAYQGGGKWTRGDDGNLHTNSKFERLLDPIGKLLFSHVPFNFPLPDFVKDAYQYIVEGTADKKIRSNGENILFNGNVMATLSALALVVGGNEQLWKPLNFVIMDACSCSDRKEVRLVGLKCLFQLMQSLGDEVMVVLPENLSILSELLEDPNEDIALLAREVVTQAEEMFGESLED